MQKDSTEALHQKRNYYYYYIIIIISSGSSINNCSATSKVATHLGNGAAKAMNQ